MNEEILKNLQFESVKDKFTKAYNDAITRQGSRELLDWITNKTDFFVAPASSKFHNAFEGGLAEHSLNVYKNFKGLLALKGIEMEEDSIIISSLLHDLCKCNYYVKEERNRKVNGKWESYEMWSHVKAPSVLLPQGCVREDP